MSGRTLTMVVIVGLAMALVVPAAAVAQETINATVTRVIDGDTIEAQPASGPPTTVRLLGIDAPESCERSCRTVTSAPRARHCPHD